MGPTSRDPKRTGATGCNREGRGRCNTAWNMQRTDLFAAAALGQTPLDERCELGVRGRRPIGLHAGVLLGQVPLVQLDELDGGIHRQAPGLAPRPALLYLPLDRDLHPASEAIA